MSEKLKIKYVFQKHHGLTSMTREDTRVTRREIRDFIVDLESYGIDLKDLCNRHFNVPDRNNILNISLIVINDEEIVKYLVDNRKLPVRLISERLGIPQHQVESYKEYIVAYMLLFGYSDYSNIRKHLAIGTTFDGDDRGETRHSGLLIKELPTSSIVMTSQGDFRYLDVRGDASTGETVTGHDSVMSPGKLMRIGAITAAALIAMIIAGYFFLQPIRVLHVMSGGPHIEMAFNRIGRLTEVKGLNSIGTDIVDNTVFSNRTLDSSLSEIITRGMESKTMDPSEIALIVMDGTFSQEDFNTNTILNTVKKYNSTLKINLKNGNALFID